LNRIENLSTDTASNWTARLRGVLSSGKKNRMVFAMLVLFLLISVGVLTSLGQILLVTAPARSPLAAKVRSLVLDNPVFSPIIPSYLRSTQPALGANVIYSPEAAASQPFSLEGSWWESGASGEPASVGAVVSPAQADSPSEAKEYFPTQEHRFFDVRPLGGEFLSVGIADLMAVLREREIKSEKGELNTNPFEEALKDSSSESSSDKTKKTAEADTSKKEAEKKPETTTEEKTKDSASADSGSNGQNTRTFFIIGRFGDQPVAIAQATASAPLVNQSGSNAVIFNLSGSPQSYELNAVLRSRENQESAAFGDLNEDGFLDLVVTNKKTAQATVYLNDGHGAFIPYRTISDGLDTSMAAISDFSGDNSIDVAVLLQADQRIIVDGKGLRRFIFYPSSSTGSGYSSMLPFDFDGDGLKDLLLTNYLSSSLSVFKNIGQARFTLSENYPAQSFPLLQSSADFGRGVSDTILVQYLGNHISIALQNGQDGTFNSLANTILDPSVYYVVGDFDQDGVIDIAIAYRE